MSDYPMLISNKLHSFRNFCFANINKKHEFRILYLVENSLYPFWRYGRKNMQKV